jgi:hypothetical protein
VPDPSKIGFNPEDRFMMTIGNTLVVVRNDGLVYGADVANGQLGPVFQFGAPGSASGPRTAS